MLADILRTLRTNFNVTNETERNKVNTKKELTRSNFFDYVKDLCERDNLTEEFKEFERLYESEDYAETFIYYTKTLRRNETLINKELEGEFFSKFIW